MPVIVEEIIAAPAQRIWAFVGDFAQLQRWHPAVLSCIATGSGVGSVRRVYLNGASVDERLDALDSDTRRIAYSVIGGDLTEMIGMAGSITLDPIEDHATRLVWSATFMVPPDALPALERKMAAYYGERIGHLRDAVARTTAN